MTMLEDGGTNIIRKTSREIFESGKREVLSEKDALNRQIFVLTEEVDRKAKRIQELECENKVMKGTLDNLVNILEG